MITSFGLELYINLTLLYEAGRTELGAPGIPGGPHLFGFYRVKKIEIMEKTHFQNFFL